MSQRIFAILLIGVQAVALDFMSGVGALPAGLFAAALFGLPGWIRIEASRRRLLWIVLSLAAIYLVKARFVPTGYTARAVLSYASSLATAQFVLSVQVAFLFLRTKDGRLPPYLPVLGVVGLAYAGNRFCSAQEQLAYRLLALGFAGAMTGFYSAGARRRAAPALRRRAWRYASVAAAVALMAALAWGTSAGLKGAEEPAARVLGDLLFGANKSSSAGFTRTGTLGSIAHWKDNSGDEVALRVLSKSEPGYLRGAAFVEYAQSRWPPSTSFHGVEPRGDVPEGLPAPEAGERLFDLHSDRRVGPGPSNDSNDMTVYSDLKTRDAMFTPLEAAIVGAEAEQLSVDDNRIAEAPDPRAGARYRVWTSAGREPDPLAPQARQSMLRLPSGIDPRVRSLAAGIAAGCATVAEKIRAVESHFHANYEYKLGISVPSGADPLTWFLLERPPAHCEYFASGAAILLRLAGVPCRYVTGFVASEENRFGGYWLARNRNAHAWVEAYDDKRGWVIVEATPASGVPQAAAADRAGILAQWRDAFAFSARRIWALLTRGALPKLTAAFAALFQRLSNRSGAGLMALVVLALAAGFGIRRLQRSRRVSAASQGDPQIRMLHRCLAQMDRRVARIGYRRQPNETLHQFARRIALMTESQPTPAAFIRRAADWYLRYAIVRFGGTQTLDEIAALREAMPRQ